MKKYLRLISLVLLLLLLISCLTGCSSAAAEDGAKKVYKLSFSIGDPASSSKAMYYQELADKTYEATDGGIDITVYSGGTLFGHLEVCEGVLSGAADMGWFYTPWTPDQYPLTEAIGLPLLFGNQMASTYAIQELYKQSPEMQEELSAFTVLNLYTQPTNYIFSTNPVESPDDLRGLQMRTMAGASTDCMVAWGASPLLLTATEIYESMDKGVIQGCVYEWSGVKSNSLYEVINYCTYIPLCANPFMVIMNNDSYANIPEEYKETFDEIWFTDEAAFNFVEIFAQEAEDSRLTGVEEYGIEETYPDDAMMELFQPAADEYIENWIAKYSTDTFDAGEYLELLTSLYAEGCELYPEQ